MAIPLEKILATKILLIGVFAARKPEAARAVDDEVTRAIDVLTSTARTPESLLRMAFYHLVRAEVRRRFADSVPDRMAAQSICERIGSGLFAHFMTVEESTTVRTKVRHIGASTSPYGSTSGPDRGEPPRNASAGVWMTIALEALEETAADLSSAQRHFLEDVSLAEIVERHLSSRG